MCDAAFPPLPLPLAEAADAGYGNSSDADAQDSPLMHGGDDAHSASIYRKGERAKRTGWPRLCTFDDSPFSRSEQIFRFLRERKKSRRDVTAERRQKNLSIN